MSVQKILKSGSNLIIFFNKSQATSLNVSNLYKSQNDSPNYFSILIFDISFKFSFLL